MKYVDYIQIRNKQTQRIRNKLKKKKKKKDARRSSAIFGKKSLFTLCIGAHV